MRKQIKRTADLGLLARDLTSLKWKAQGPSRDQRLRRIVDRLGLMHGLPQKIGQLLAFSDLEHSNSEFRRLTENAPALSTAEAFAEIERLLGKPLKSCFHKIEPEGISASIGQVHRALTYDGRKVAVKFLYPGIREAIECDLKALQWICAPIGNLASGFSIEDYRTEIGEQLRQELDYHREAATLRRFRQWFQNWEDLVLPEPIGDFCNESLLTTTWVEGGSIEQTWVWTPEQRSRLATTLVKLFFEGVFRWRCLHADPNPGNYRFHLAGTQPQVGLIDFGCVKEIPISLAQGIVGLIADQRHSKTEPAEVLARFVGMGFDERRLWEFRDRLPEIAQILTEPFQTTGLVDITPWNPGKRIAEILGPHRLSFRFAGPPALLFFLRSLQGVLHYLKLLRAPVAWRRVFEESIQDLPWPADEMQIPQCSSSHAMERSISMKSEWLHVEVQEEGVTKVAMSFGAEATDRLESLVPEELHATLRSRNIHLRDISDRARRMNYQPGELFSLDYDNKRVRVWLT